MSETYFETLHRKTENRFWINNPSSEELSLALERGAVACTTNPAYCSRLMSVEPDLISRIIDETVEQIGDPDRAAQLVYQRATQPVLRAFRPVYKRSDGQQGFVTMQSDPRFDEDAQAIVADVQSNRTLGPNYMAKIPVIEGAIPAIDFCVEENIPICATEVFAVSQARVMCERYERMCRRFGTRPPLFITHITGIFDEYLKKVADREGISIDPAVLGQAGLAVARKEYRILQEAGFNATMMGGGAREPYHFTGLIGGKVHITINWSTAAQIMSSGTTVSPTLDQEVPKEVISELRAKFLDFRKAYDDDGLLAGEFASYGPVQLFRNAFLKGWYLLLAEIATRKHARAL